MCIGVTLDVYNWVLVSWYISTYGTLVCVRDSTYFMRDDLKCFGRNINPVCNTLRFFLLSVGGQGEVYPLSVSLHPLRVRVPVPPWYGLPPCFPTRKAV